jgi:biotin carboxyl carrier protein
VIAQVEKGEGKPTRLADPSALNSLSAPMPGLVVGIHTQEGERVEKGQVLVTLESMKMQMELRAPVSGRVTRVGAQSRVQIDKGALLVEIKPE